MSPASVPEVWMLARGIWGHRRREEISMKYYPPSTIWLATIILLLTVSGTSLAQNSSPQKNVRPETKKSAPVLSLTQQRGLENLDRIALEARQVDNPAIRADLQALIGDALWDFDKRNARNIFVDAFKNARSLEDRREAATVTTIVVKHVWARDRALAEELMKQLSESKDPNPESTKDSGVSAQFGMQSSDPTAQQKIDLARDLVEEDPAAAADLIEKTLAREVSFAGIAILNQLKTSDPERANRIFVRAVSQLQSMPATSAVLAAIAMADYVSPTCSVCQQQSSDATITRNFYAAGLRTLRRSLGESFAPPPVKRELQDRLVQYFHQMQAMLALTLSRFAAPADVSELQAIYRQQMQTLEVRKQQTLQALEQSQKAPDKLTELIQKVESIPDQEQRDLGMYNLVTLALRQDVTEDILKRLEEKAETIESKSLHDKAWSLLKLREIEKLTKAAEFDRAHVLSVRLPDPTIRARALRGLSLAVIRKGSATLHGPELLSEALDSLNRADISIERSQIMFKISGDFVNLRDYDRAFGALQLSTASIAQLERKDFAETTREAVPNSLFDYSGTFGRLGSVDFDKSMFLAQAIKWREFRLAAEIATCRSVLNRRGQDN
jgi:hypothetical protein